MHANVHEGEGLTPQAAVAEIRRIESLHGALARRASGLTWMIWGIVAPAIFISYALLGILVGFPGTNNGYHALWILFPVLWAPWAAIGLVATATLWRSVGLVIPRRSAQMREGLLTGAAPSSSVSSSPASRRLPSRWCPWSSSLGSSWRKESAWSPSASWASTATMPPSGGSGSSEASSWWPQPSPAASCLGVKSSWLVNG